MLQRINLEIQWANQKFIIPINFVKLLEIRIIAAFNKKWLIVIAYDCIVKWWICLILVFLDELLYSLTFMKKIKYGSKKLAM